MVTKPQNQPDGAAGFEAVEHTADWALHVWGNDLEELFTSSASGMSSLIVADADSLPMNITRTVNLEAFDAETLLVDWLSELYDQQVAFAGNAHRAWQRQRQSRPGVEALTEFHRRHSDAEYSVGG